MEKTDLEKAQEEARKRQALDNTSILSEPQHVGQMCSERARLRLNQCHRTKEQIAADAESFERKKKVQAWQLVVDKIGDRYGACSLEKWKYHGTAQEQVNQREVVARVARYAEQLPERIDAGSGLLLFGPPGTGKDHMASAVMRDAVLKHGVSIYWVNGVELYAAFRDSIGKDTSEQKLVSQWVSPKVLVLSDPLPPFGSLTEFQASMLFRIIDSRYRAMKPTWMTLNVIDSKEASERLGTQVVSRMRDNAVVCRCEWQDYRTVIHK